MKEKFGEFLYFIFVCVPVFCIVITAVYVGFFFYDTYNLLKKLYAKILQIIRRTDVHGRIG